MTVESSSWWRWRWSSVSYLFFFFGHVINDSFQCSSQITVIYATNQRYSSIEWQTHFHSNACLNHRCIWKDRCEEQSNWTLKHRCWFMRVMFFIISSCCFALADQTRHLSFLFKRLCKRLRTSLQHLKLIFFFSFMCKKNECSFN